MNLLTHRLAKMDDLPALRALMNEAIGELLKPFLTPAEIEASFSVMGLDSQLITDQTYFAIESDGRIVGCGGWSWRATLFGGDHSAGRNAGVLDPARDAAHIRAMYTLPDFARKGVGRLTLKICEEAAATQGFGRAELAATLAGEPLYRACGYSELAHFTADTPSGVRVPLIRMGKRLD